MRKITIALFLSLICSGLIRAQVSGSYTIPGTTYPTIASAISAINASGIGTGGVTFNVSAGYTETFPSLNSGLITTTTSSASNPITFIKSGSGANPVIAAAAGTTATTEYIICLQGTDYITFDGIDLSDPSGTVEWGYAILKASGTNGSQYVTIKNSTITLNKTNVSTVGIYANNVTPAAPATQLTVTTASGINSNIKIYSNTFSNCYTSIFLSGFNDPNSPFIFYDQSNEIGKDGANTITNFGGGTALGYGIYTIYQNNLKVANNTITSAMAGTNSFYGIYLTTAKNASYDVYNNTVSLQFSGTGTNAINAIYCDMGAGGSSNLVNIYNNTVTGCTYPTMTSGNAYLMYLAIPALNVNIYNNNITNNTIGSSTTTSIGRLYGLYCTFSATVPGTINMHDNNVTGNTRIQSVPGGGTTQYINASGTGALLNLYNNIVANNVVASNGGTYGINASFDVGVKNVYNNQVYSLTRAEGTFYGLYIYAVSSNTGTNSVYQNRVTNIEGLTSGCNMYGMYITTSGGIPTYIYNNMISDLRTPAALSTASTYNSISGIYISSGSPVGIYYNSVYLRAASSAANFGSSALYYSTSASLDLRNNILVNNSTPSGSGKTVAIRFSSTTYSNYSILSNYNDLYAGTPGASNVIFTDNTNTDQTLLAYKTRVSPRELQSVTEIPPFVNTISSPWDLHLQNNIPTQCEAGGTIINTPVSLTTDFDNNPRYANAGYPVNPLFNPKAPDIGMDEISGLSTDITSPSIIYTPLQNTYNGNPRTITATITDGSGVPVAGAGLPVLYWKVNSGSYQAAQGTWITGSTYSFTFGSGTIVGDVVFYYIAAQDLAPAPNIGIYPWIGSSGLSSSPPSCSTPPTTPYSYSVIQGLSGIYHVGAGKNYTTLTAAINDINAKFISGPLTLVLDDPSYLSETFPITITPNPGSSQINTLTIKPNTGISTAFSAATTGTLLNISGFDYLVIDGSNNGTGSQNLTFENANTNFATSAITFSCYGNIDPATNVIIKNCIIKCLPVHASGGNAAIKFVGTGGGYINNLITGNTIKAAFMGIQLYGTAAVPAHNNLITNNVFGSSLDAEALTDIGVITQYADSTLILNNEIMGPASGSLNTGQTGVYMSSGSTNTKVRGNKIHDFIRTADDGWGASGIWYSSDASTVTEISNNLIYNIHSPGMNPGVGQNITYGIFIRSGGNIKILHNTINLYGAYMSWALDASSACIAFYYQATGGNFEVRNNIFRNGSTETSGGSSSYGKAYGIMISIPTQGFSALNNNDYFIDGYNGTLGEYYQNGTGIINEFPTLASWQLYTGQEANSVSVDPVFTSPTNVMPTTTAMSKAGVYIPSLPTDYAGITRTNPPDIGAYEFSTVPTISTLAASGFTYSGATLNGNGNPAGFNVNLFFDWGLTTSYGSSGSATPALISGNSPISMSAPISGLNPNTLYHFRARGVTISGITVYGNDMTFNTYATPPLVITTAAGSVTTNTSVLNGTVNPNGVSATVSFQYGLTTAYGSTVTATQSPVSGSSPNSVSVPVGGLLPNTTYHFRVVSTNNGGTSPGNDMTFTTNPILASVITSLASNITAVSAQLNGSVNANYAGTTLSFDWGTSASYGNSVAANPGTVSGSTSTPVFANISGLAWNTAYHFRLVGVNAAGTAYGNDITFNTNCPVPAQPTSLIGPAAVCQNQNAVVFSIAPLANASNYNWTVPAGASILSGAGTLTITVNFSPTAVSGNITVTGTNFCSTGATGTFPVTVNPMPVPVITGAPATCAQSTNNVYTTQAGMSNYTWTVSAGGTITTGATTNAITVTWSTTGAKVVTVNYANANGCSAAVPASFNVTVNALPAPTITGATSLCATSGYYTYSTEAGQANYTWTVSSGGSIYSGSGTSVIQVMWNTAGPQTVSVNYTNASLCQAVTPAVLNVTVNGVPSAAGSITGTSSVCAGSQGVSYSVAPVAGALAYAWNLPVGVTIASGANTNAITVNFASNAASGPITVSGNNLCGNGPSSPAYNVAITPVPAAAGTITGPAAVCKGSVGIVYTVPPVANATAYTWTVPSGVTVTSGSTSNSITVTFGSSSVSGSITVYGSNTCGNGLSSALSVTVNPIPTTPVVTASGYVLTSSAASGNQWYHDGTAVPGATAQTYTVPATAPGWYWTVVTLNTCSSDSSNHVYIQGVGIGEHNSGNVSIYPVPNDGHFNIAISSERETEYKLDIYNSIGIRVYGDKTITVSGTSLTRVDLGDAPAGLYTVVLRSTDNQVIRKILVNK